jgi:tetratricopeptide (TPR) repeat protein
MLVLWFLMGAAFAASPVEYELRGQLDGAGQALVSLFGSTTPFSTDAVSDSNGRFRFRKLLPGTYTMAVFVPGRGEARRTVEVGPSVAGRRRRVEIRWSLKDSDFVYKDAMKRRHSVQANELRVPQAARREFEHARRDLERRDVSSAVRRLERAVELAPHFAQAWNTLGTIAYQTRNFARAEECFRRSLEADAGAYEPLVNLGGVLVTLRKLDEALSYNLRAVLERPNDALANVQLGMTYFELGGFDLSARYLQKARDLDPAHFSHPQLLLAEIHLRRNERRDAADDLQDFLRHHPDWPHAEKVKATIAELLR